MATRRIHTKPASPLSTEQKVAFGFLVFLGLGGVVLGFQSFGANLSRPVQEQLARIAAGEAFLTSDEIDEREREEAKTKDTDGDGLVDYDELYVYKTSPYLSDSDSDGFDDKQEVYSGNNPNCPTDKTCCFNVSGVDETTSETSSADVFVEGLGAPELLKAGSINFESEEDVQKFFKQATMQEIRSALLAAGMSEEELERIDDETLEALFYGLLDEAAASGELSEFVEPEPEL